MTTWYKTERWKNYEVTPVEVEKHTDKSVWVNGRRQNMSGSWGCYFQTEIEAWEHLKRRQEFEISNLKSRLQQRRSWLGQIEATLKRLPPKDS